eukprot:INCI18227.1.p1 GENE.INCI18227.1~~INCI18227.1.p1  ORF type:complete len:329 (-),score=34.26 INCI18227.1:143-1129(-)
MMSTIAPYSNGDTVQNEAGHGNGDPQANCPALDSVNATSLVVQPFIAFRRPSSSRPAGKDDVAPPIPVLRIPYKPLLSGRICWFLAKEFIQHVLYLRQQIPSPVQDLRRWSEEQEALRNATDPNTGRKRPRRLVSGAQKQIPKLLKSLDRLLEGLQDVLADPTVRRVVLVFGNTILSAMELYELQFVVSNSCDRPTTQSLLSACARKMARFWLQSQATSVPARPLRKTRLHVLLEAPAGKQFAHMLPKAALTSDKIFGIRRRRKPFCSRVCFYTIGSDADHTNPRSTAAVVATDGSSTGPTASTARAETQPPLLWYQFEHALHAIKKI